MEQVEIHKQAISEPLWGLLGKLMAESVLSSFILVGGTALALLLGHRKSEDIDLFRSCEFDTQEVTDMLTANYQVERIYNEKNTVSGFINGIKTDMLSHIYPMLGPYSELEGIRIASVKDIAAMKLNAVSGRGLKKDFWDIASLLEHYKLSEMIGYYHQKYPKADNWHLIRSLTYFTNAENDKTPIYSLNNLTWDTVKKRINHEMSKLI